jgi:hypothetical protein
MSRVNKIVSMPTNIKGEYALGLTQMSTTPGMALVVEA